ncbi:Permease of the major facilitator superfamily protein [Lactobacillus selangorensis]|uniref:Bcr/CflA family efflux transporter n=1 Tax=Lactobacillus selangorensis TaxID=81857 RepID=A0A0R2G2V2_9LACO|nr:multidrug effflux MFS transporter [Lactobacillus selangorensis]KRN29025.1 Permease of the major facilitator superfamily protein [Lactobacillus selangorensis]KRN32565.1 Permease of the major facilitator superfamily protein [Lactobacillus selangorensis]
MTKTHRIFVIFLLGTLSAFGPLSMDMYLPALPELERQLHTTTSLAQLTITACIFGLAAGQLIIGPMSDRWGRRGPLLFGLALFTVTAFGAALTTNVFVLIGLRFLQGIAGSAGQVLSRSITRDLFVGPQLTQFFAILMAINGIFPILAPILGGFILSFTTWKGIFWLLTVVGVILIVAVWFGLPETLPKDKRVASWRNILADIHALLHDRNFMTYVLTQGFVYAALFSYISGASFVFQDIFHMSAQMFSVLYAINGLGIVVATRLTGELVHFHSDQTILVRSLWVGTFVSFLILISLALPNNFWPLVIGLFIVISLVGMVNTTATSLAMQSVGDRAGSASAILGVVMNGIGGCLSPLIGIAGDHSQVPMDGFIFLSELAALGILIWGLSLYRRPQSNKHA